MQSMIGFCSWIFNNLPYFLFTEPVNYLFGLVLLSYVLKIFFNLFRKGAY